MKWICGDVHGNLFTLKNLLLEIKKIDRSPQLFFVGDYLDRGRYSKEVLDLLISLQKDGAICIRGNHDDVVDYIVNGHSLSSPSEWVTTPPSMEKIVIWWLLNGFGTTLSSYGVKVSPVVYGMYGIIESGPDSDLLAKQLQEGMSDEHKKFLNGLKLWHEDEEFFIFHAYHRYYEELPRDFKFLKVDPDECLWNRFNSELLNRVDLIKWDKKGIFGHTPVGSYGSDKPICTDKLVLLDMGMNNGLAAYCVECDKVILVETDRRDLI